MSRAVLFLTLFCAADMSARADDWENWRDGRRVLLVLAPSREDALWVQQTAVLSENRKDLGDRDVLVLLWAGDGDAVGWPSGGKVLRADALARRFPGMKGPNRRVVLIGRDGEVKASWNGVVPAGEIFSRIDAMPMGRREKEARENKRP